MKKIVKLAVIRKNDSEPCPFGLDIIFGCKTAGENIDRMFPTEKLSKDLNGASEDEIKKVADANRRLHAWIVMSGTAEPAPCKYAGKLFPDQNGVDCNYGDAASGQPESAVLLGSPAYSKHFTGVSLDGLYSYPLGYLADYNISRNSFYGIYSIQGTNIADINSLRVLAMAAVEQAVLAPVYPLTLAPLKELEVMPT